MSTNTAATETARPATRIVGYDEFIEGQLQKTRSQVKWCDISGAAMTLLAGTLINLFAVALVDHWILSGGLGFWGRVFCLAVLVAGGLAYAATTLLPLLLRRINPVYAAHAIEQSRPTLKNSLVNFLLLRSSRAGISDSIYQAVEQQAASKLSQVHVDTAIDRSRLVKIFGVLLVVVTVCCLYTVLSPKNPLRTVRRVILPWADITAPTRVTIAEVSPGDTSAFHDGYVNVQAVVRGVSSSDPVTLYYSTRDGQTVGQPIPMQRPADAYRHTCVLPATSGGLRQSVSYYIAAGDARSPVYQVEVRPAPAIAVEQVDYQYPKYTGLEPSTAGHGDLKALEGTRVTLHARANQDIGKAFLDLESKGRRNKALSVTGREARVTLPLRFQPGGQSPEFSSYQIRFSNTDGHENPQPIRHTVEIVRDQPPEVKLVEPEEPQVDLPINRRLPLKVQAFDPDFALSKVEIVAERVDQSGNVLWSPVLLEKEQSGPFEGTINFDPEQLKLKVGDVVRCWAEARDNRRPDDNQPPQPNRGESEKRKIRIVAADQPRDNELAKNDRRPGEKSRQQAADSGQPEKGESRQQAADRGQEKGQPPQQSPNGDQGSEQKKNDEPGQAGDRAADAKSGDKGEPSGEPQSGEKGDKGNQGNDDRRVDPMTNPGDAFDEILRQKQQDEANGEKSPNEKQPNEKQPNPNEQGSKQDGSKQEGSKQEANKQEGSKQGGSQQQGGKPQGGEAGQKPDGEQSAGGGRPAAGSKPEQGPAGSKPQGGENAKGGSDTPAGKNQAGEKTDATGEQKPQGAGDAAGANKPGEKPISGQQPQSPEKPAAGEMANPMGEKGQQAGEAAKSGDNGTPSSPDAAKPSAGKGSEVKGAGDPNQKPTDDVNQKPDTQGGDREKENGNNPGAALKSSDNKPTPSPQEKNQDRGPKQKQDAPPQDNASNQGENAASPGNSTKQSDSKGGAEGDRAGGGKKGGAQPSSGVDGAGGPGQNTASDEGNKKAPGAGEGETSDKAGNKVQSDKPTGNSDPSGKSGAGSKPKPGGEEAGGGQQAAGSSKEPAGSRQPAVGSGEKGAPAEKSEKQGGEQPKQPGDTGDPSASDAKDASQQKADGDPTGSGGNQPTGGSTKPGEANNQGNPTTADGQPGENRQAAKPQEAAGDAANLDYAKKATDLALEHLKDQLAKDKPDPELLDKLKWSREDMQRFVDHWEKMKREAQSPGQPGEAARKKLDESLRGLGLRPQGTKLRSNEAANDQQRDLRSSRRTSPPAEFAEQVKAYKQGLGKGKKSEK